MVEVSPDLQRGSTDIDSDVNPASH